jgi:hypothetical protein
MRLISIFLAFASTLIAEIDLFHLQENPEISIHNTLLTKVNGRTISAIDVMKKMDIILHQKYPQYADSPQARYQFYVTNWRPVLMEMIDTELIISDAQDKEIALTDGDVREEMESRFGPNVLSTLEKIGLTFNDAWKMTKNDLIVQRMTWFFIHSRAMGSVTPQLLRDAYHKYVAQNPSFQEWVYRVISVRCETDSSISDVQKLSDSLAKNSQNLQSDTWVKEWEALHPDCKIQFSQEYIAKDIELSESYRSVLAALLPGSYSQPICQTSRSDNKAVYRIFHLVQKSSHSTPSFETMKMQIKNELLQKAVVKESEIYIQKLRKHYGFDLKYLQETMPDDLQPFRLQ